MDQPKFTDSDYLKAFMAWSGAKKKELQIARPWQGAFILYKGETYKVDSFPDFREEYRQYFDGNDVSYEEVYTMTHQGIWDHMLQDDLDYLSINDLIVGVFKEWQRYWQIEKNNKDNLIYEDQRRESWEHLQILIETIKQDSTEIIKRAAKLDDIVFIPIIAAMIRRQFDNIETFLDTVALQHAENGRYFVTMGDLFEDISITTSTGEDEVFYIYNPMLEFKDLSEPA